MERDATVEGAQIVFVRVVVDRGYALHQIRRLVRCGRQDPQEPLVERIEDFIVGENQPATEEGELTDGGGKQVRVAPFQTLVRVPVPGFKLRVEALYAFLLLFDRIARDRADQRFEVGAAREEYVRVLEGEARRIAATLGNAMQQRLAQV